MKQSSIDMFGIGHALLDVDYNVDDSFLKQHDIEKRHMTLVDEERMLFLINALEDEAITSTCGGSVANTLYAMRGFGKRVHFAGRVAPDDAGHHFVAQLEDAGIGMNEAPANEDGVTGRCLVLVTADAERTMNTCLGASERLQPAQIDVDALRVADGIFIEGYLASSPTGRLAAQTARELADEHALETNLTLADTSMVKMFRGELETIIGNGIARVFCNLEEALEWCHTDRLDIALTELRDMAQEVVVTLGPGGCAVNNRDGRVDVPAVPTTPIDLNGAGDMFAAAYLAAIVDHDVVHAARFANFAASHIIQRTGARLDSLDTYAQIQRSFTSNPETESIASA